MKKVSARIHLHLVQLTHKHEVYHGSYSFPCNDLRITTRGVECLDLPEGSAYHGAHQEGRLLLIVQGACLFPIRRDVKIAWRSIIFFELP